jgi:hypothetical protein
MPILSWPARKGWVTLETNPSSPFKVGFSVGEINYLRGDRVKISNAAKLPTTKSARQVASNFVDPVEVHA